MECGSHYSECEEKMVIFGVHENLLGCRENPCNIKLGGWCDALKFITYHSLGITISCDI